MHSELHETLMPFLSYAKLNKCIRSKKFNCHITMKSKGFVI